MIVRPARSVDDWAVDAVLSAAFGGPTSDLGPAASTPAGPSPPPEVSLVHALRASDDWLPSLALVAQHEDDVVGFVCCTRGHVGDVPALGLGPLAVLPALQRHGIGATLLHAVVAAADATGEPLVALLGHVDYYPRFGFVPGADLEIDAPDPSWGAHFMVRRLSSCPRDLRGRFRYADAFGDL